MKSNTYIDYLSRNLNSHLGQTNESERNAFHQARNNLVYGQAVNYKSTYIRDLVNFYISELEFTPQEFVKALSDNRRLIEILYGAFSAYISDRRELQNIFEPALRKDIDLLSSALKECLNSHHNILEQAQSEPTNQEVQLQLERNTQDFKNLLDIIKQENLYHKIPKSVLYTKNSQYKKIMKEARLLENEVFEEKKLIELFKEGFTYRRSSSPLLRVTEYCLFYIKEVTQKFDSLETFNAWAASYINVEKNAEGKVIEIIKDVSFFDLITKDVNDESQPYQDKFIDQWLNDISFRQQLTSGYCPNLDFMKSHPHKIISFLDKLTSSEKTELLNKGISDCDFNRSGYDFRGFLNGIPLDKASPLIHSQIIERLINFRKESRQSENIIADNAFFSAALNQLVAKSLNLCEKAVLSDEEKVQAKLSVLNVYLKNRDIMFSMIHDTANAISDNVHHLESNFKELKLNRRELNLSLHFFDEMEALASHQVEVYFKQKSDRGNYSYMSSLVEGIRNSVDVVSALGIYSTLDKFDLFNITINKEKRIQRNKKGKYFDEYPAIFEIIEHTEAKDKGLLNWILQEKHLPLLKDSTLYKKKNIVEFFSTYEDAYGHVKTSLVELLLEEMMNNKEVFRELVLSKKKALNSVKDLKNDFIQSSIKMMTLDRILEKKEDTVKIRRKI